MQVPIRDADEHPGEEERAGDPQRPPCDERLEPAPPRLDDRSHDDRKDGEVGEIRIDRRRPERHLQARLVPDVEEEDRDRRSQHDRAGRHASVRQPGRQRDGDYTLA